MNNQASKKRLPLSKYHILEKIGRRKKMNGENLENILPLFEQLGAIFESTQLWSAINIVSGFLMILKKLVEQTNRFYHTMQDQCKGKECISKGKQVIFQDCLDPKYLATQKLNLAKSRINTCYYTQQTKLPKKHINSKS